MLRPSPRTVRLPPPLPGGYRPSSLGRHSVITPELLNVLGFVPLKTQPQALPSTTLRAIPAAPKAPARPKPSSKWQPKPKFTAPPKHRGRWYADKILALELAYQRLSGSCFAWVHKHAKRRWSLYEVRHAGIVSMSLVACLSLALGLRVTTHYITTTLHDTQLAHMNAAYARIANLEEQTVRLQESLSSLRTQDARLRAMLSPSHNTHIAAEHIPSLDPTSGGIITSGFGWRTLPWPEFHRGVDLAADEGHPVKAAASGVVVASGWFGGFGNRVAIDHGNGYQTWYGHLSHIDVSVGAQVKQGTVIAEVGQTGEATGPHLHYQIMHNGEAIDPMPFLHGPPHGIATR